MPTRIKKQEDSEMSAQKRCNQEKKKKSTETRSPAAFTLHGVASIKPSLVVSSVPLNDNYKHKPPCGLFFFFYFVNSRKN